MGRQTKRSHGDWKPIGRDEVLEAEREAIAERRKAATKEGSRDLVTPLRKTWEHGDPGLPSAIGLALSGGGVRSACFAVGVIDGLREAGVFPLLDYISSVSGGGYAAHAHLYRRAETPPTEDRKDWKEKIRGKINYLQPYRLQEYLEIGLDTVRGAVAFSFLPHTAMAVWAGIVLGVLTKRCPPLPGAGALIGSAIGVGAAALVVGAMARRFLDRRPGFALVLQVVIGLVLLTLVAAGIYAWLLDTFRGAVSGNTWITPLSTIGTSLGAVYTFGGSLAAKVGQDRFAAIGPRLARALAGVAGFVIPALVMMAVAVVIVAEPATLPSIIAVAGAALVLGIVLLLVLDINANSLLSLYRDRLVHAFPLRDEVARATADPIHLACATINLGTRDGSERNVTRTFVFSQLHVGWDDRQEDAQGARADKKNWVSRAAFDVATGLTPADVMAISGAVASPTMGRYTMPELRLLLTLLNVRLGHWIPNPARPAPTRRRPPPSYLLNEAFSQMDAEDDWVYLTDGGHEENLGGLELIRRQCRVVIIADAEFDPEYRFEGLFRLVRLAFRECKATVDINPRALKPGPDGVSRRAFAVGKINYDGGHSGTLVYFKACRTRAEEPPVSAFAAAEPAFPHHPTANQFFGPAHFDAYSELGRQAVVDAMLGIDAPLFGGDFYMWVEDGAGLRFVGDVGDVDPSIRESDLLKELAELEDAYTGDTAEIRDHARHRLRWVERAVVVLDLCLPSVQRNAERRAYKRLIGDWAKDKVFQTVVLEESGRYSSLLRRYLEIEHQLRRAVTLSRVGPTRWTAVAHVGTADGPTLELGTLDNRAAAGAPADWQFTGSLPDDGLVWCLGAAIADELAIDVRKFEELAFLKEHPEFERYASRLDEKRKPVRDR